MLRLLLISFAALSIPGSLASIYGSYHHLGPTSSAFFGTTLLRSFHVVFHIGLIGFYAVASRPRQLLAANLLGLTLGCIVIGLRLSVAPPPDMPEWMAIFNITRDGIVLLLIVALIALILIPGWFAAYAVVLGTALGLFLAFVHGPWGDVENADNLTYVSVISFGFILALGNTVHRLRRESFLANAELREANARLEQLATTDDLTRCANRRYLLELGEKELQRARRYDRPLGLILLDVDRFKDINDQHGHAAGDAVLRALADIMRAGFRESDIIGRIGGEEFAILLPETGIDQAKETAERIRRAVAETEVPVNDQALAVTASFGVAERLPSDAEIGTILARADNALYRAKDAGRNRVEPGPGHPRA